MSLFAEIQHWFSLIIGAIIGAIGAIGTVVAALIRNRRVPLTYHVRHDPVGISASDSVHGNVEVTIGGRPVQTLYMSNVWLVNRGWRDVENLDVTVLCAENGRLASASACIEGEPIALTHTDEHQGEWDSYKEAWEHRECAKASGDQAGLQHWDDAVQAAIKNLSTRRCYAVSVLNRGQTTRFTHMMEFAHGADPGIFLSCQKAGVRVQYKDPYQPLWHVWSVPLAQAGSVGFLVALVIGWVVINTIPVLWPAAAVCLFVGAFCNVLGAGLVRLCRWIRAQLIG